MIKTLFQLGDHIHLLENLATCLRSYRCIAEFPSKKEEEKAILALIYNKCKDILEYKGEKE